MDLLHQTFRQFHECGFEVDLFFAEQRQVEAALQQQDGQFAVVEYVEIERGEDRSVFDFERLHAGVLFEQSGGGFGAILHAGQWLLCSSNLSENLSSAMAVEPLRQAQGRKNHSRRGVKLGRAVSFVPVRDTNSEIPSSSTDDGVSFFVKWIFDATTSPLAETPR